MGKYEPLAKRLRNERSDLWTADFSELERVLGFSLPTSARSYREWWANQRAGGHSQTKGWQDAGWQVWKVDLGAEQVTVRRVGPPEPVEDVEGESDDALVARAGEMLGKTDRGEIVRDALRALIQREAARRLAALGGSMPDLQAPPRRRFG